MVKMDDRAFWDEAYSNAAFIKDAESFPPRWARAAAEFRQTLTAAGRAELDLPYGEDPRERYDLFHPQRPASGLVIFIHGGYWMSNDKSLWSHLAAGPLARDWAVAMPSYSLCPSVRIAGIKRQVGQAVTDAAARQPGPLRLTGHSAGGHLVSRLACIDTPLGPEIRQRLAKTVAISGLPDLRPLLATTLNQTLRLDETEAQSESPALLMPLSGTALTCWVGAAERPEFRRQNALLANIWAGLGATTRAVEDPGRHHFDVIDGLADPHSPLIEELLA